MDLVHLEGLVHLEYLAHPVLLEDQAILVNHLLPEYLVLLVYPEDLVHLVDQLHLEYLAHPEDLVRLEVQHHYQNLRHIMQKEHFLTVMPPKQ